MSRILSILQILLQIYLVVLKIAFAVFISFISSKFLLPIARVERGYDAYGGEWILIIFIFLGSYSLLNALSKAGR